jgi:hypothetical protein
LKLIQNDSGNTQTIRLIKYAPAKGRLFHNGGLFDSYEKNRGLKQWGDFDRFIVELVVFGKLVR